jgi:hypothetical protein
MWSRCRRHEDFLDRAGRLAAQRRQAEEIVLADVILLPPEPGETA